MKMILWLYKELDKRLHPGYDGIDKEEKHLWLMRQFGDDGFKSYFKSRDYQLLKTIGNGLESKEYWLNVGRRMELLHLLGSSKDAYDKEERKKRKTEPEA